MFFRTFAFAVVLACAVCPCITAQSQRDKQTVYTPGGDVKPPKLIHYVEPDFSSSSKEAFIEGIVRISTVVTHEGIPSDLHVVKGLSSEQDQHALEAVAKWRFDPGTKNGTPVDVKIAVEVDFHLM